LEWREKVAAVIAALEAFAQRLAGISQPKHPGD